MTKVKPPLPDDVPPEAAGYLEEIGYFEPDTLNIGDVAPPVTLSRLHGPESVRIPPSKGGRPIVLIFGSYT